MAARHYPPLLERIESRLVREPPPEGLEHLGDCEMWQGPPNHGYGQVKVNGKPVGVHLARWRAVRGPVPDGLQLDHLCERKLCAALDHLEPVTQQENARRAGRHRRWYRG